MTEGFSQGRSLWVNFADEKAAVSECDLKVMEAEKFSGALLRLSASPAAFSLQSNNLSRRLSDRIQQSRQDGKANRRTAEQQNIEPLKKGLGTSIFTLDIPPSFFSLWMVGGRRPNG
jgi:hypothetical protein